MEDGNSETPSYSALEATQLVFAGTPGKDFVKGETGEIGTLPTRTQMLHVPCISLTVATELSVATRLAIVASNGNYI